MNAMNRLKKWINSQLEKLAKENRKTFGDKAPDCCEFGRATMHRRQSEATAKEEKISK
jgi:hypothetical protein